MTDAGRVDIDIDQGADFICQLIWLDNNGNPYQVQHPIRMQCRTAAGQVVLDASSVDETQDTNGVIPGITYNTTLGVIQINLTSDQTAVIPEGAHYYDIFTSYTSDAFTVDTGFDLGNTRKQKLIYGRLNVEGSVTKTL